MVKRRAPRRKRKGKPRGRTGRRPTGLQPGEKIQDYPHLTVRVPPDVRDALKATAKLENRPVWRVLVDAITRYCEAKVERTNGHQD